MQRDGFDVEQRQVVQKKKVGLFNHKLRKATKQFDKQVEATTDDAAELRRSTANVKTLVEMVGDGEIKAVLIKIADMLEYAAPSSAKRMEKADEKIANKIDDVKLLVSGGKSAEKIAEKVEELRIAVIDRNNLCEAGV